MPARTTRARQTPEIYKFGGASLADAAAVRHALDIIAGAGKSRLAVVVSAMAGVTDALIALTVAAETGDQRDIDTSVAALVLMHRDVATGIATGVRAQRDLQLEVARAFEDLRSWLDGVRSLRELTPRSRDLILARGEELSARLVVAGLLARGIRAELVDAASIIPTDGTFGGAFPDLQKADRAIRDRLEPLLKRRIIPVVPGFTGGAPDGAVVTLGRGGSDLTATVLGRALRASRITLWKDVPGLMTTDPRMVPAARVVPQLNTREAAELAYYGAKVLHPRALIPLHRLRIPVFVRPFANPASAGTEISARRTLDRYPVKALSVIRQQALVTVTGNGMLGVPGIAARTFSALHGAGISVALISQASSEQSICLCVPADRAGAAQQALTTAFASELSRHELDGIDVQRGMAMLAVVGLGMAGRPGIAARKFSALSGAGVNIVAIAQGSSELNISVVIAERDAEAAALAVHEEFQMSKIGGGGERRDDQLDVVLLGFGQIGRELVRMLPRLRAKTGVNIVALIDRSGFVFERDGMSARRLSSLTASKEGGVPLASMPGAQSATAAEAVAYIAGHALARTVLVDLTADDTMTALRAALTAEMDIVLANKRPLSAPLPQVEALHALAEKRHCRILHETTVGAGLPVMDSYGKLVETGDKVLRIEGCTSGTLGYLLSEMGQGHSFSDTLRAAMKLGFTEPDPRDDLSGMDVARKALILARLLGFRGELADVTVESLVPSRLRRTPLDRFLATLETQDAEWAERQSAAAAHGKVLRYVLEATPRKVVVGLRAVPPSHPLASLRGTDNQIVFTTMRYREHPLVITGPGAGPTVTAAGVLNDILQLAE
ncbi:MAG: bifunctional aspartate kinase/homoserine dehydrogenase I [Gemmatimonadota bacterium]